MDEGAIERAKSRIEQRGDAAAIEALFEQARAKLEGLVAAAEAATEGLSERVEEGLQHGLRDQVAPVARNLAEIRGLMNQLVRRLDSLEGDSAAERHARVDDLALLVDLISTGWKGVDARLGRVETIVTRIEQGLEHRGGAVVYRIEDRRPDAANGP